MQRGELRRTRRQGAAPVSESEARHQALVAALPFGVVLQDATGTVLTANQAAAELVGVDLDALVRTQPVSTPEHGIPLPRSAANEPVAGRERPGGPDESSDAGSTDRTRLQQLTAPGRAAIVSGTARRHVVVPVEDDGRRRWLSVTAVPLLGDDGRPQAVVSSILDVTADHERERALRLTDDMFRLGMQHSPIGFAIAALNGRFLRVNRKLCRMLGFRADELQQRTLFDVLHPEDVEDTSLRIGEMMRGELPSVDVQRRYLGHGGMVLWGALAASLVHDDAGRPLHLIVQVEDASEIRKAHELLTHMTLHDPLTGLPNRTLVVDRVQKALDRGRRTQRHVAVLVCDLDHFKVINDSAGHELGDTLLVEISRRITRALRPGDVAGRLGGDEFVVVCEDVTDEHQAIAVAERVQAAISAPVDVGHRSIVPTVSVGIALSGSSDTDPLTLLRDADISTYRAKERGRDRWDLVDPELRARAVDRLDIEHSLRMGLELGELRLHFQPIVDVTTRSVIGREALVRWQHPERGLLAPGAFLQVAEDSGLIDDIGEWVLGEAARTAAHSSDPSGYVAINVSPHQVSRPGLAGTVDKALTDAGLPPERLVIELTESVMLSAAPSARQEIAHLDDLGVRIVVDDFGTGFSALSYLRDLPVSGIKVDRSFTAGLGLGGHCERIVEALTGLGKGLGVDVIVEGVETEEQRDVLAAIGAEHAQGYLFGRPGPSFEG